MIKGTEACDDGNIQNGDGCSSSCKEEGICAYPGSEVSCFVSDGCAVLQVKGNNIVPPWPSSACVFETNNVVYRKNVTDNNFIQIFSCTNDDVCRQKETYGADGDTIFVDTS